MIPDREEATSNGHFTYFMVRVRVDAPGELASFAGVVERLGTGRKRAFSDGQTLLRLIGDWSQLPYNMSSQQPGSNDSDRCDVR